MAINFKLWLTIMYVIKKKTVKKKWSNKIESLIRCGNVHSSLYLTEYKQHWTMMVFDAKIKRFLPSSYSDMDHWIWEAYFLFFFSFFHFSSPSASESWYIDTKKKKKLYTVKLKIYLTEARKEKKNLILYFLPCLISDFAILFFLSFNFLFILLLLYKGKHNDEFLKLFTKLEAQRERKKEEKFLWKK